MDKSQLSINKKGKHIIVKYSSNDNENLTKFNKALNGKASKVENEAAMKFNFDYKPKNDVNDFFENTKLGNLLQNIMNFDDSISSDEVIDNLYNANLLGKTSIEPYTKVHYGFKKWIREYMKKLIFEDNMDYAEARRFILGYEVGDKTKFGIILGGSNRDFIRFQKPNATCVYTKQSWDEYFLRGVKKDAQPLYLISGNTEGGIPIQKNTSHAKADKHKVLNKEKKDSGKDVGYFIVYDVSDTFLLTDKDPWTTEPGLSDNVEGKLNNAAVKAQKDYPSATKEELAQRKEMYNSTQFQKQYYSGNEKYNKVIALSNINYFLKAKIGENNINEPVSTSNKSGTKQSYLLDPDFQAKFEDSLNKLMKFESDRHRIRQEVGVKHDEQAQSICKDFIKYFFGWNTNSYGNFSGFKFSTDVRDFDVTNKKFLLEYLYYMIRQSCDVIMGRFIRLSESKLRNRHINEENDGLPSKEEFLSYMGVDDYQKYEQAPLSTPIENLVNDEESIGNNTKAPTEDDDETPQKEIKDIAQKFNEMFERINKNLLY